MASPVSPQSTLPTRTGTNSTDADEAIPDEDSSEATRLFHERLQAWKHACAYLEDYISATEKALTAQGKEYDRVLRTVSHPLKEGQHFDQALGGIAGMFDNIRSNTQGLSNSHAESAKTLKGSVLPVFERLHAEIKNKTKELTKGAGKGAKAVDKARLVSQKHIELLGQYTATFDATGGNVKASEDPYILQRQIYHRLHKQVLEENNNRDDLISVQNNFARFETHVVTTVQDGLAQFYHVVTTQADQTRAMYGDMQGTTQRIPPDFEWNGFLKRNMNILVDPTAPKRSIESIAFPNQDHRSTQPLIAGSLERKGKLFKGYDAGFYVITPSKYLHEFKTDDDFAKDPVPESSLYLPDCLIGAVDGVKFNVKGKDTSKGSIGNKLAMSHEFAFKAHTPEDAKKWHDIIASVVGQTTNEPPESSVPSSPTTAKSEPVTSPLSATGSAESPATTTTTTTGAPEEGVAAPKTTAASAAPEKEAAAAAAPEGGAATKEAEAAREGVAVADTA